MANSTTPFAVNERVRHDMYGLGTIKEINQLRTTIDFDQEGRKKFVTSMVQLERSSTAPPEPASKKKSRAKKPGASTTKTARTPKSKK